MKDTVFQSSAYGKRESVETIIDGRTQFDMLDVRLPLCTVVLAASTLCSTCRCPCHVHTVQQLW